MPMWMSCVAALVHHFAVKGFRWGYPFKSEKLQSFFIYAANIEAQAAFSEPKDSSIFPIPQFVQRDPVSRVLRIRQGKSQGDLSTAEISRHRPS